VVTTEEGRTYFEVAAFEAEGEVLLPVRVDPTPPLQARRVPIHSKCSRPLRLGEPPEQLHTQLDAAAPLPAPSRCRGCLARQHLDKADSDLYSETRVHETPVLLSILERVVDQLGTDEEPESSTLSLTAKSADHQTRSWWSTPADDRLPRLRRTPIRRGRRRRPSSSPSSADHPVMVLRTRPEPPATARTMPVCKRIPEGHVYLA